MGNLFDDPMRDFLLLHGWREVLSSRVNTWYKLGTPKFYPLEEAYRRAQKEPSEKKQPNRHNLLPYLRDLIDGQALAMTVLDTVPKWAGHFRHHRSKMAQWYSQEDAINDAWSGVMHAALIYDPHRGTTFGTYALYWANHAMQRSMAAQLRIVYRPARSIDPENDKNFVDRHREEFSLETKMGGRESKLTIGSTLVSRENPFAEAERNDNIAHLHEALAHLDKRSREVLLRRAAGETLSQVGRVLRLTKERIRQIQDQGLEKLKWVMRNLVKEQS